MVGQEAKPPVFLIGSGNLAHSLALGFAQTGYTVTGWWARNTSEICLPTSWNNDIIVASLEDIPGNTEIVLLAVSDSAIQLVSELIPSGHWIVCHCSGSVHINQLNIKNTNGVFYPLQTFTKGREPDWKEIPVFTEANTPEALKSIKVLASALTPHCLHADSEKRLMVHLAAVISANFSNHLLYESLRIMQQVNLDFKWQKALMQETISKAFDAGNPALTQTGPAKRNDNEIIGKHLKILEGNPEMQQIYKLISEAIKTQKA
jgi:predicted short-subunit dehydrogenase-like oxidoreductase (DUF2520 family)